MITAYIGLGSNLNNPVQQISQACIEISALPNCTVTARSSLYQSQAIGVANQPDYVNAALALQTTLSAAVLLNLLQQIENQHQRDRSGPKWGARTLDLDLLLFGQQVSNTAQLQLPHPEITRRNFVLLPLLEIAPDLVLPNGQALKNYLPSCPPNPLHKINV